MMWRGWGWAIAALALPAAAHAQSGPEQIEQLEPGAGEWQLQYSGAYGGADGHELEIGRGVGRHWALGVGAEVEAVDGHLQLDGLSAVALLRLIEPDDRPVGLGMMGQVSVDRAGRYAGSELRGIAESRSTRWWLQANVMLRHRREEGEAGTSLDYVASIQHGPAPLWYGIEVSGRAVRLAGDDDVAPAGQHYIGPSLTYRSAHSGLELGLAWMARVAGGGAPSGPRVFAQLDF
ncbi:MULTISPECIES: hypothetical protein [Sphingomonas]|uniref:Cellulose biosynthesis protein BcsS n=1 Tax=Sphingomonas trueperi TaxID=53317 RepID=A0A7X5XXW4_9SPHN|nr:MULTISPECIES: hypothetical protein [Sphingomonas]NJB97361.1 hypothetical protein [Sphingomonas trueperi]